MKSLLQAKYRQTLIIKCFRYDLYITGSHCKSETVKIDNTMSLVPLVKEVKKKVTNKMFMLKKLRKFITFEASVAIYKQMILPFIDYAGFLLIGCLLGVKGDLQKLQNDMLRICDKSKIVDRVSIELLHEKCNILSLEQRMRKQILWLMYILSKDVNSLRIPPRETRNASKIVFKLPTSITPKYERSPFYIGTKLWDELPMDVQKLNSVFEFKKEIGKRYRKYSNLLKVRDG